MATLEIDRERKEILSSTDYGAAKPQPNDAPVSVEHQHPSRGAISLTPWL
jgi:hypothetical protein